MCSFQIIRKSFIWKNWEVNIWVGGTYVQVSFLTLETDGIKFGLTPKLIYKKIGMWYIVITDSPFLISCIYNNSPLLGENYNQVVKNIFCNHKNLNILLQLNPDMYQQSCRNESANQSRELENRLIDLMFKFDIPFTKTRSCEKIIEMAKEKISSNNFKR